MILLYIRYAASFITETAIDELYPAICQLVVVRRAGNAQAQRLCQRRKAKAVIIQGFSLPTGIKSVQPLQIVWA
jgi:hypothetical protein